RRRSARSGSAARSAAAYPCPGARRRSCLAARAHSPQGAGPAGGPLRVARPPAVAQQMHVELELGAARRQREHLVVQLVEGRARPEQPQAHADTRDVRVDGHVAQAVGEQQHAGRGLAAHPGQRAQVRLRLLDRRVSHPGQVEPAAPPVLYVHGVPTSSDDWIPFPERTGGVAPDLPGFGRSGKRGDLDYTMEGYERFLEAFLELVELDRVRLVVHDWGAVGLLWAMRFP